MLGGKFTLWYNLACLSPSNKNCLVLVPTTLVFLSIASQLTYNNQTYQGCELVGWLLASNY